MWSHDEQKEINDSYAVMARITCKYCGAVVHKYVESHYTGGSKCVILAKYCRFCGNALRIQWRQEMLKPNCEAKEFEKYGFKRCKGRQPDYFWRCIQR